VQTIQDDQGNEILVLSIPASGDLVAWSDITKGLVRAAKLNEQALEGMLPRGQLNLQSAGASLAFLAINVATDGCFQFEKVLAADGTTSALRVTCNRSQLKRRHRELFGGTTDETAPVYRPALLIRSPSPPTPVLVPELVLCVHGYGSEHHTFDPLRAFLHQSGCNTAAFEYDFRQPIEESAKQLSAECKKLRQSAPEVRLAVVAHSMGGLVARASIEFPELNPGSITKLITLGTPHGGSVWANAPPLLNARGAAGIDLDELALALLGADHDQGFRDLIPDSPFLRRLNGQPRNGQVQYTVIVGTGAGLSADEAEALKGAWQRWRSSNPAIKLLAPRIDPFMADLAEITEGAGDGAVAVKRAQLPGTTPILLPFRHTEVLRMAAEEPNSAWPLILARLKP
jgi:pimeloyl-ACP methyl ester carboxylesterase